MKKIILVLLCLCIMFNTGCANGREQQSSAALSSSAAGGQTQEEVSLPESAVPASTPPASANVPSETVEYAPVELSDEELLNFVSDTSWYHYFMDGEYEKLYWLSFYPSSGTMEWNIGYFESEWENTFGGSFRTEGGGVFYADLYDEVRESGIQLVFTLEAFRSDDGSRALAFTITDSNHDKYAVLENEPILFVDDPAPDYPLQTADFTIEYETSAGKSFLSVAADRKLTLKENVLLDGADEESFRFSVLENTTANDYFRSLPDRAKYQEVEDLSGKTANGYAYRVFYKDVKLYGEESDRHYKFFITIDETTSIVADAVHYARDGLSTEKYYEKYILPVVQSLNLKTAALPDA